MLLLPLAATKLGLSIHAISFLLGGSIQAVGQVVSAGFSMERETGELTTLVKMFRALMIAMAGIGLRIHFASLLKQAPRALGVPVVGAQLSTLSLLIFWLS